MINSGAFFPLVMQPICKRANFGIFLRNRVTKIVTDFQDSSNRVFQSWNIVTHFMEERYLYHWQGLQIVTSIH